MAEIFGGRRYIYPRDRKTRVQLCRYLVLALDDGSDSVGSTGRKGAGLGLEGPKLGRWLEFEMGEGGVVYLILVQKFFSLLQNIPLVLLNTKFRPHSRSFGIMVYQIAMK